MIELEQMGSYVWQEMDGQKTVYELACMEREKFGDRAEPACERLSSYLKILRECGYICYVNKNAGKMLQNCKNHNKIKNDEAVIKDYG